MTSCLHSQARMRPRVVVPTSDTVEDKQDGSVRGNVAGGLALPPV